MNDVEGLLLEAGGVCVLLVVIGSLSATAGVANS